VNAAYSIVELAALGVPVEVEDGSMPCDRVGCSCPADVLIPGASLCRRCFESFVWRRDDGCGSGGYEVPVEEVVGGPEWRRGRDLEYAERLRDHPGFERRFAAWDERLDQLAADAVDDLLEDLARSPA
jgi:hypothetical protein